MSIIIYIVCHNDETFKSAKMFYGKYEWAKILQIDDTIYMESWTHIHDLRKLYNEWKDCDYVGTITHTSKTKILIPNIKKIYESIKNNDYDVVPFITCSYDLVSQTNICHKNLLNILKKILEYTPYNTYNITSKMDFHISNYWIIKPKYMLKYIEFINSIYNIMENNDDIKKLLFMDPAGYIGSNQIKNEILDSKIQILSKEKLAEKFGTTHFSHHCFIGERLPSIFFYNNNLKCYNYTNLIMKSLNNDDLFFIKEKKQINGGLIIKYIDYELDESNQDDYIVYVIEKQCIDGFPDIICKGDSNKLTFWNFI